MLVSALASRYTHRRPTTRDKCTCVRLCLCLVVLVVPNVRSSWGPLDSCAVAHAPKSWLTSQVALQWLCAYCVLVTHRGLSHSLARRSLSHTLFRCGGGACIARRRSTCSRIESRPRLRPRSRPGAARPPHGGTRGGLRASLRVPLARSCLDVDAFAA